jgi:hypothetical protein
MSAFEEKESIRFKHHSGNRELSPVKPLIPFKVVVNNYKQQKEKTGKEPDESIATVNSEEYGLPPQPESYLKYPEYDWF